MIECRHTPPNTAGIRLVGMQGLKGQVINPPTANPSRWAGHGLGHTDDRRKEWITLA